MTEVNLLNSDTASKLEPPRIPAHQWRLLLPLALLLLAAAGYIVQRGHDSSERALRLAVLHQSELAARVAAGASQAVGGEPGAFFEIRRSRTRASAARETLKFRPSMLTSEVETNVLETKLTELDELWTRLEHASEQLLESESAMTSVRKDVEEFQSIATGILVTADELVDALVKADAPAAQIRAASRQLLLMQRISANVRRVLEGGEGMITAADRFGRDAVLFGDVNNALLVGNPEMNLIRVRDGAAREILVDIGREFRRTADLIEQIMSASVALSQGRSAAASIIADSGRIESLSREIEAGLSAANASRIPLTSLIQVSAVLAVLSLLFVIAHIAVVTRRVRIEARRHTARVASENAGQAERVNAIEAREIAAETAIRRLVDELDRLSRGDAPSPPTMREEFAGTSLAPLEVAINAVRRRFGSLAQASARVSAAGGRFVSLAKAARGIAEEQRQQVERAAKATRLMAAQVETVSGHGRQAGELVGRSAQSIKQASEAAEKAGGQAQKTLSAAKNAAARIRQLNESTRQIQDVGRIVDELSEQCRMLGLNVSIRASMSQANGGVAAGRFAEDVQKLSADARRALKRIDGVNEDVRAHAAQAADSMKELIWAAENTAGENRRALKEINILNTMAKRLQSTHTVLIGAMEEHTVRMTHVVKSTTSVHQVSGRARGQIRDCAESAHRLSELAGLLEAALTGYDESNHIQGSIIELPAPGPVSTAPGVERDEAEASKRAVGRDPG